MKSLLKMFALSLLTLFVAQSFAFAAGEAGASKYGYVDVAKVFDSYQKTKDNDRVLQEAGKKKETERDALVHEIRQMKDDLALLKEDARAKKQEALENKVRLLSEFDRGAKQALGEQRNKVVQEIFKDIDTTIQTYGKTNGFEYIFNERSLLYRVDQNDLTNTILAELNKAYTAKKKK